MKIENLEKADVVRFIDWYEEDATKRIKMTIGMWNDSEHELAELAREFKKKCIDYYKKQSHAV